MRGFTLCRTCEKKSPPAGYSSPPALQVPFLSLAAFFQVEFAPLASPIRLLREEKGKGVKWNIEGGECKEDVDCSIEDVAKYV